MVHSRPHRLAVLLNRCLAFSLGALLLSSANSEAATQILMVHSYSQEYAWTRGQHDGFVAALKTDPGAHPTLSTEYLDTKRRSYDAAYAQVVADHLRTKYAGYQPAAIYVSDDNALLFARDHLRRLFPAAPIFFSGVNDYAVGQSLDPRQFTGIFEKKEVAPNLDWLLRIDPELRTLVFVGDGSNTHAAVEREIRKDLAGYPQLQARFIGEKHLDQVLERLRGEPSQTLFLTTLGGMTDARGEVLPLPDTLRALSRNGRRVISMEDAYVRDGVLGGFVTYGAQQGAGAARLLLEYLHGKPLTAIPHVLKSPNTYLFDDAVLEAQKLNLPEGIAEQATLLNPRMTFFDTHRTLVVGGLYGMTAALFVVILAGLFIISRKNRDLTLARAVAEKSEKLLREAISSIEQGFTIYDEHDRLMICNDAYRNFYAASADMIVPGNTFEDIVRRGAERGQYESAVGRVDEWVASRVAQHQAADGKAIEQRLGDGRWLLIVEHRTPSGFIAGNRIDITALKQTELALHEAVVLANQIIENAPEPMLLVDRDGRILRLNRRTEAVLGYRYGELLGQSIEILIPEHLRKRHQHHLEGFVRDPVTRPMGKGTHLVARHKDGSSVDVEISLAPVNSIGDTRVIVAIRDVSEYNAAIAALVDRDAQLNALFQLSPDGLVSFDCAGRVKMVNPAILRMTGLLAAEIMGLSLAGLERLLRELADTPEQWPGLGACFAGQDAIVDAGETAVPGARPHHQLVLREPRGAVLDLIGVTSNSASVSRLLYVRDVTHEAEIDRMKSEFLSHAAHELRTPMASIYGFTELLMSQEFDAPTRQDLLATIHKQTQWLVAIINELLDLARIEARRGKDFRIETVPIASMVGEVIAAMNIDPARWPLSVDSTSNLPPVLTDVAKLNQALTNVLGNAIKYSPAGGAIEIYFATRDANGKVFVGISVTDHGIGMTQEQAAHVCERFYRADTSGRIPGTGLGMSIVKEIVELLDGQIEIVSALGVGTTVTLWLPANRRSGAPADTRSSPSIPTLSQEQS